MPRKKIMNTKNHKGILAEICIKEFDEVNQSTCTTGRSLIEFDYFENQRTTLLTQFNKVEITDDIYVFSRRGELM